MAQEEIPLITYQITITGQVQGVGFRPFVYTTAFRFHVRGTVSNNEEGVIIYATAPREKLDLFYRYLVEHPPEVARIKGHNKQKIKTRSFDTFSIVPSKKNAQLNLQLTPDFALCEVCMQDIAASENRRYYYPFTTCTYCGPRWAITNFFPFERDHTNMKEFKMCPICAKEYKDPLDRRFHSQTNSCSQCGVQISLTDGKGNTVATEPIEVFKKIAALVEKGKIIAVKNTSGYLLCCDARNAGAVQKLRIRKKRPAKPFAILYPSLEKLQKDLEVNSEQQSALTGTERPIVLISADNFKGELALQALAPGLRQLGVMLPYTALLDLMMREMPFPVVATSGNMHGSPILRTEKEALSALGDVADYFLHHNLEISNPQDDSVVKYSAKFQQKVMFRRSRGYAPNYYGQSPEVTQKIMALGGHLKSTIAFLPNDFLYISQYLGNLDHYDVYERFTQTTTKFISLFEQPPDVVLIDKHPSYLSSQYGLELSEKSNYDVYKIQHHKAHFASVLGEHALFDAKHTILGVVWDGTGYGDDGHIWGGEFFSYRSKQIERISHFQYFDWLAGDKMALDPRLSLFSLANPSMDTLLAEKYTEGVFGVYKKMKQKNALKTSSVGRLFDAVASMLGICDQNTYEGESAILLENCISDYNLEECKSYISVDETGGIPTYDLIEKLHTDLQNGVAKEELILNFLYTLASLVFQIADQNKIAHIACSGGVFQNTILLDMIKEMANKKYKLYFNCNLSPNDENISFGQVMYYVNCMDN